MKAILPPLLMAAASAGAAPSAEQAPVVRYESLQVKGVDVFYREAGPKDAPAVLLLHGFGA